MKKLIILIVLLTSTIWLFGQDAKPTGANIKQLQAPNNATFYYNTADSTIGIWKGGTYKWNYLWSAKKTRAILDSLGFAKVDSVTGILPIVSTKIAEKVYQISINAATDSTSGAMPATDKALLDSLRTDILPLFYSTDSTEIIANVEYGYLYNWWAVTDAQNISPIGFHVPTSNEYRTLRDYLGGYLVAGDHLKETGTNYWTSEYAGTDNSSGFNGRGAGNRNVSGVFAVLKSSTRFLTTTAADATTGVQFELSYNNSIFDAVNNPKYYGYSLRFIADSGTPTTATGNDGKIYSCVTIGTQTWTAENSMETKYRDGTSIPEVTVNATWAALTTGARCSYDNDEANAGTVSVTTTPVFLGDTQDLASFAKKTALMDTAAVLRDDLATKVALGDSTALKVNKSGDTMTGNLLFTDNTLDIGASGATRPRTGYFGTSIFSPLIVGGSAVGSNITYKSTTGVGTATGIAHQFLGGNNGATVLGNYYNNSNFTIGSSNPVVYGDIVSLTIGDNSSSKTGLIKFRSTYNGGDGAEFYQNTSGNILLTKNSSLTVLVIDAMGNMAVGSSTPTAYADIITLTLGDNSASKMGLIKFKSTYNTGDGAEFYQNQSGFIKLNVNGSVSAFTFTDTANLGLGYATGTEITDNKLAVNGSGYFNGAMDATSYKIAGVSTFLDWLRTGYSGAAGTVAIGGGISTTPSFKTLVDADIKPLDQFYAEMYTYENTTATTIGTEDVYHAVVTLSTGMLSGFTFVTGIEGTIASVSDYSGTVAGTILVTDVAHGLLTGDIVTIHATTDYNGTFAVTKVTDDTYYVTETYTSDQTGNWAMGSYLLASTGSDGVYKLSMHNTALAGTSNEVYKFELNNGVTMLDNIAVSRKFGTAGDYGSVSSSGLNEITAGDRIWMSVRNETSGADVTIRHCNINIVRL